jgi:hypothetical protein
MVAITNGVNFVNILSHDAALIFPREDYARRRCREKPGRQHEQTRELPAARLAPLAPAAVIRPSCSLRTLQASDRVVGG